MTDPNAPNIPSIVEEKVTRSTGEIQTRTYLKGKFLGKGGFARCYEFTNQETGLVQAAKVVVKASLAKSRAKQKLMSEIKIHRSIRHQHVVQFQHFFEDTENVYILLELCANQSMNELLRRRKRMHEVEVQCYSMQIINALKYLHAHRIIHRDLKLGNLFINDKMEVKLGDFGLASKLDFDGEKKRTICGTPNYIAPEVLEGKSGHSYEVDIWSLGVIMYTLIIGKPPFETQDVKATYKRIKMNAYTFPEHVPISEAAKDIISKILIGDPTQRPTLDGILAHEFFTMNQIPKTLPPSFLACPPSNQYIRMYQPQLGNGNFQSTSSQLQQRLESTAPANIVKAGAGTASQFSSTNRITVQSQQQPLIATDRGVVARKITQPQTQQERPYSEQQHPQLNGRKVQDINHQQFIAPSNINNLMSPKERVLSPTQVQKQRPVEIKPPSVWVKKWVDYSSKYGLGYMLSNNCTGVFFNDSTKILIDNNGKSFYYYERKAVSSTEKQDVMTTFSLSEYPKDLAKKVTLLQHFRSYLETNNTQQTAAQDTEMSDESLKQPAGNVYVKKWMRTKHAIMFRLSNKIVQVNFQDHTEILLNSESRLVTYVNKKGERQTLALNVALESNNAEMTKRLKYTKDILTHMLTNNGGNGGAQAVPATQKGPTTIQSASSKRSEFNPPLHQADSQAQMMLSSNRRPFSDINQ